MLCSLFWTNPLHCHDLFCQSGKKRQVVLASFGTLSLQQCWWNIKLIFCLFPSRPKSPCVHILWSWSRGEGGGHRVQHCQDLGQRPGAGSMTWSNEIFLVFVRQKSMFKTWNINFVAFLSFYKYNLVLINIFKEMSWFLWYIVNSISISLSIFYHIYLESLEFSGVWAWGWLLRWCLELNEAHWTLLKICLRDIVLYRLVSSSLVSRIAEGKISPFFTLVGMAGGSSCSKLFSIPSSKMYPLSLTFSSFSLFDLKYFLLHWLVKWHQKITSLEYSTVIDYYQSTFYLSVNKSINTLVQWSQAERGSQESQSCWNNIYHVYLYKSVAALDNY